MKWVMIEIEIDRINKVYNKFYKISSDKNLNGCKLFNNYSNFTIFGSWIRSIQWNKQNNEYFFVI